MRPVRLAFSLSLAAILVAAGTSAVSAAGGDADTIKACVKKSDGDVRIVKKAGDCHKGERFLKWNEDGEHGPPGPSGGTGPSGPAGPAALAAELARVNGVPMGFTAVYGAPSGTSVADGNLGHVAAVSPATDLVAKNLSASLTSAPGAGHEVIVELSVAGFDTLLRCTVADLQKTCTNTATTVAVPANSLLAVLVISTGGASATDVLAGYQLG